jgi:ubiquinone/menaquinone biosynthesis C-methylase UbiE
MAVDRNAGNAKVGAAWARRAPKYDKSIGFVERRFFGDEHRSWACSRASGTTLEVAVGTGLNLPLYDPGLDLMGIDLSPEMLSIATERAAAAGVTADLRQGDAHELPFEDGSFDSVVCTYSLCNIPDPARAVLEMKRVLKPDGKLILVDHIASTNKVVLVIQKAVEFFTIRFEGEHMTRRPRRYVEDAQMHILESERRGRSNVVERLVAVK